MISLKLRGESWLLEFEDFILLKVFIDFIKWNRDKSIKEHDCDIHFVHDLFFRTNPLN